MILRFKNKMTMGLQNMVDDGLRRGGILSHIDIIAKEALEILTEVNSLNPQNYSITDKSGTSQRVRLNNKQLTTADLEGFVAAWKAGEWKVEYRKVEIRVVDPTPQTIHLHS